jgi:hypothetical protein
MLKPTNSGMAAKRAQISGYKRPVILGHQKWMLARKPEPPFYTLRTAASP